MTDRSQTKPGKKKVLVSVCGGGWGYEVGQLIHMLENDVSFCYMMVPQAESPAKQGYPEGPYYYEPSIPWLRYGSFIRSLIRIVALMAQTALFIRRQRPEAAIAVASVTGVFMLLTARVMGCKTIYVESITRVRTPSNSMRLCRRLRASRHIFAQWPKLAESMSQARYEGSVL